VANSGGGYGDLDSESWVLQADSSDQGATGEL